ncbi:type IV pilus assembly PilZ [Oleiphilus messinensis]|uniref:Type IV pilus assembly PilZ n=1 Tax=Oleiphilus messinensis TaxID=141451 RepID=A0A1Y0I633_9GAMM|nr:PilZ domain-containing protein [Oleiphilus messinensis]ARU55947.1 type IV pilus assembly PilZ [Oleiphilus messinensis]
MKSNLRYHHRIRSEIEATLLVDNEELCSTTIANISRAGIMIECNQKTLEDILPNQHQIAPKKPVQVEVEFNLPLSVYHEVSVKAYCNVIHTRRLSKNSYQIGLEFAHFANEDFRYVEQYMHMHAPTTPA